MSQKIKSSLYLLGFVVASLIYYNQTNLDETQGAPQMASLDTEQVSSME